MRKTLHAIAALATLLWSGTKADVMAQDTYDNVAANVAWAVGNESKASVNADAESAMVETSFSVGTDLVVATSSYNTGTLHTGTMALYQPQTSNPGCVPGDMIEYKVKVKKGLTFKPTSVAFDAVKEGTDGAFFSWSYTVDGVESDIVKYNNPKEQIRRNNDANPSAPLTHNETITHDGGRVFTLRLYISDVANNKKMAIGNIKINGTISGTVETRKFTDFFVDFRTNPYTVKKPESGVLPEGVTVSGTFHDAQHGNGTTTITVPCDGPVKFTLGSCQYGATTATVKNDKGETLATIDCNNGCDDNVSTEHFVVWYYNSEEPAVLTITSASYIPFFGAEACELLPMFNVEYYNTDGKLIGKEEVQGGSGLKYAYGEKDVTVGEGQKFRGWFGGTQNTSLKIAEGTTVQDNLKLYARATMIEVPTPTSRFIYDLTKAYFYLEDHEALQIDGKYYNNHGWLVNSGGSIKVNVAGKCYVTVGNCNFSAESMATVTNSKGEKVAEDFQVKGAADGAEYTFTYDGPADWLSITFPQGSYTHSVAVWNVVDFVEYNEATGYYEVASGDVSSFLIALKAASSKTGSKIFLHDGLYDLGTTVLTSISGNGMSIVGESMTGTIIRNAPPKEQEGIGTTATLYNTSSNLYLQDLTIQNALDYYGTGAAGRAVCLQDKGRNTICKNVLMLSYQDTYYSNAASNFYWEDSEIHGTVDYLCGDGNVTYNRCKFVNESRDNGNKTGSDVLAAPYTSEQCTWGYVFLDCEIESRCKDFTFARSWGGNSTAQFVRTKILDNSLNASRWTTGGMNVAAYKFKEYGTMDKDGKVTTPASNVVNFTHTSGDRKYETVLSDEEVANYTVEKIYGTWAPDVKAAQLAITDLTLTEGVLTWPAVEGASAYAVCKDGAVIDIVTTTTYTTTAEGTYTIRTANTMGGFGKAVGIGGSSLDSVEADTQVAEACYNLRGQRIVAGNTGLQIVGGQLRFVK